MPVRHSARAAVTALALFASLTLGARSAPQGPRPALTGDGVALAGYPLRTSVRQSETLAFCVSSAAPTFDVDVVRMGASEQVLLRLEGIAGVARETPADAYRDGCGWPVSFEVEVGEQWPSGLYSARLSAAGPSGSLQHDVPFVVRAAEPGSTANILALAPDYTVQAYNIWGGSCLYETAAGPMRPFVSFQRPQVGGAPGHMFTQWRARFFRWIELAGYGFEAASDVDLHREPGLLDPYDLLLLFGHHEYWSAEMRAALDAFVANGGNVLALTGNTGYWQVRFEDDDTRLRCHKDAREDPLLDSESPERVTSLWAFSPVAHPPERLLGQAFRYAECTSPRDARPCPPWVFGGIAPSYFASEGYGYLRVFAPEHFAFAGSGLERGDLFGLQTFELGEQTVEVTAFWGEVDGVPIEDVDGLPVVSVRSSVPANVVVLADAPARSGFAAVTSFEAVGTVLTAGCVGLPDTLTLPGDRVLDDVDLFVRNALDTLSAGRRNRLTNAALLRRDDDRLEGWNSRETRAGIELRQRVQSFDTSAAAIVTWRVDANRGPVELELLDTRDGADESSGSLWNESVRNFGARRIAVAPGAHSLELLIRTPDVAGLHGVELIEGRDLERTSLRATDATSLELGAYAGGALFVVVGEATAMGAASELRFVSRAGVSETLTVDPGEPAPFAIPLADTQHGRWIQLELEIEPEPGGEVALDDVTLVPLRVAAPRVVASEPAGLVHDLFPNGGFEHAPLAAEIARGTDWSDEPPGWAVDRSGVASLDKEIVHSGRRSLRLDGSGSSAWAYSVVPDPLLPDASVRMRLALRSTAANAARVEVRLSSLESPDDILLAAASNDTANAWEIVTLELDLRDAADLDPRLPTLARIYVEASNATAWIDDLTLHYVEPSTGSEPRDEAR